MGDCSPICFELFIIYVLYPVANLNHHINDGYHLKQVLNRFIYHRFSLLSVVFPSLQLYYTIWCTICQLFFNNFYISIISSSCLCMLFIITIIVSPLFHHFYCFIKCYHMNYPPDCMLLVVVSMHLQIIHMTNNSSLRLQDKMLHLHRIPHIFLYLESNNCRKIP